MNADQRPLDDDCQRLSTDELIDRLCTWGMGVPVALVEAIVARGPEAVPRLAEIVASAEWWNERRPGYGAAVIHALHLLGLIGAPQAADALLTPLRWDMDSDFLTDSAPGIFARLGPKAIPALRAFVLDANHDFIYRGTVYEGLMGMVAFHPELREQVIQIGRQTIIKSLVEQSEFPPDVGLNLVSFHDPADLARLHEVYDSDLWADPSYIDWDDVLEVYEEGLAEHEQQLQVRDPMDYFQPEEQARLKRLWAEWEEQQQAEAARRRQKQGKKG